MLLGRIEVLAFSLTALGGAALLISTMHHKSPPHVLEFRERRATFGNKCGVFLGGFQLRLRLYAR